MRKLAMFNAVTLDGFFSGPGGDLSWAHGAADDAEWNEFVAANSSGDGALVFGRVTFDMMASWWPTPAARQAMPDLSARMTAHSKIVFSRTLKSTSWENTTFIGDDLVASMRRLKTEAGPPMTILGSGSIVSQLAAEGLIDEYQLVIRPVALGKGRTLFEGLSNPLTMVRRESRVFKNGSVWLRYEPTS
jgi:dihydrofolate reductase